MSREQAQLQKNRSTHDFFRAEPALVISILEKVRKNLLSIKKFLRIFSFYIFILEPFFLYFYIGNGA